MPRAPLNLLIVLACSWAPLASSQAEDVVTLSSAANRRSRSRIAGEVVEYTGRQIVVRLEDGREVKRPGQQVVSIETQWPSGKDDADRLFDEQQFHAAREKYVVAIRKESRAWARRAMLARIIACHRELNQLEAAGKLFLSLVKEDPDTPYYAEIPVAWRSAEPSASLEQIARQWVADERPLAQLLGASHLLSTIERQEAADRLSQLSTQKDSRIASLAEAQAWRTTIPTADDEKLAMWERRVETFPDRLRAGPYWILGRALGQHGHADRAALAYLHVPLLYPHERILAADSLYAAALILEKQGDAAAGLRLRRELVARFPGTPTALDARSLLPPNEQTLSAPAASEEGDNLEQTFLAGLRSRRLFALAEERCRQRLAETGLSEAMRVELAVELSRTLTEHAFHESRDDREPLWDAAVVAVRTPGGEPIRGSRRLLLDAQRASVHLAHGELARQEADLAGADEAPLDAARQELRTAADLFDDTLKAAGAELRRTTQSRQTSAGDLNASELAVLARRLEYQLARTFRNQGQSYPPKSADRTNSLRQAEERLRSLAAADVGDDVSWPARLDEVVCLRLLELFDAAHARLSKLADAQPPSPFGAALEAEQIRLLLDRRELKAAVATADAARASAELTADLDYACLEAYVAAWQAAAKAKRSTDAADWENRAADLIGEIDDRFGRYWSRRAEMLLAGSVTRGGETQNLAVLVRAAESLYRSGQFAQALQAYDHAARQANDASQPDAAFEYAFKAAAIEQHLGRHANAAKRFREVSLDEPKHERAADAHLLAIYNTALAAQVEARRVSEGIDARNVSEGTKTAVAPQKGHDASLPTYLDLLNEHLEHWPRSPTANQVRLWLGALFEREGRWSDAIEAYRAVPIDGAQAQAAVEGVARSYQHWLAALTAAGQPTGEIAARAAGDLEKIVTGSRGGLPERWSETERIAAAGAAAIWLTYTDDQFARAERLLSAALADSGDAAEEWKATAQTLEVFAVAAQGQRDKAAELLSDLSSGEPSQILRLIEGLAKIAEKAPTAVSRELAELELRAAQLLDTRLKELPAAERRDFRRAQVRALAAAGRHDEALTSAGKLAEAFPRDGQIQEEYAGLLLDSGDRADWQVALTKWRDIGQKTRQGSDRWLRAMYSQSLALVRLDQKAQALRLIKLTEAISPDLGGAEMKKKFRELAR